MAKQPRDGEEDRTVLHAKTPPLYEKLRRDLVRRLTEGEWRPAEVLPPENQLAAEYKVSIGTLRKAVEALVSEHLLIRRPGTGTYVSTHAPQYKLFRFYRLFDTSGERVNEATIYVSVAKGRASEQEAAALLIKLGTPVSRIVRLRHHRGAVAVIERIAVREDLCPNITSLIRLQKPDSIYLLLEEQFKILITRVNEKLRAVTNAESAILLGVSKTAALLEITRIAFGLSGEPLEYRVMHCSSDTIHYGNDMK